MRHTVPNSNPLFARVVVDSNLPQLDREFEYRVPEHLVGQLKLGALVTVPFGKGKQALDGYVVGISNSQEFAGQLAELTTMKSRQGELDPAIYSLCKLLAQRNACSVSDLLKLAIPTRAATVEISLEPTLGASTFAGAPGWRRSILADPSASSSYSGPGLAVSAATEAVAKGSSILILVPDLRSQASFSAALSAANVEHVVYAPASARVSRYRQFSAASRASSQVILGSRSAAFLPVHNLETVFLWDDGDPSYLEPTAPYVSTREVLLARQQLEGFNLAFVGNSISTEAQRLCEVGYFEAIDYVRNKPRLASSEDVARIDSLAWRAIRDALEERQAVLVQVAARGGSVSVYCKACKDRMQCRTCNGPIWIDEQNRPSCRWCNAINLGVACQSCGNTAMVSGRAGATRTATELGKAFPGTKLVESTGASATYSIKPGPQIVVATPGAEPTVAGGYGAVVLLDAANLLTRDSLRAREEAIRLWANALALLGQDGRATLTGVQGQTAQALSLWQIRELMATELAERRELGFPPAVRMASVVSTPELLQKVATDIASMAGIELLGPIAIRDDRQRVASESRLLIRYQYANGSELAARLKALQLDLAAGNRALMGKSGRAMRPLRVRMEEVEVI